MTKPIEINQNDFRPIVGNRLVCHKGNYTVYLSEKLIEIYYQTKQINKRISLLPRNSDFDETIRVIQREIWYHENFLKKETIV